MRGLATIEAANRYLRDVFMPDFNARFGVAPAEAGTAFVAYAGPALEGTLCLQERPPGRARQLRQLARPQPADPAAGAPSPLRPGNRPGARIGRWLPGDLRRPPLPGTLPRRCQPDHRPCPEGRMTHTTARTACGLVDNASAFPTIPPIHQQQERRTFDLSYPPDIFTRHRHFRHPGAPADLPGINPRSLL